MASCPNCGFDLTPSGSCPVCGYGASEEASQPAKRGRRRAKAAAEGSEESSNPDGRSGSRVAELSPEGRGTARGRSLLRRERLPWLLGGAVVVVLVVVAIAVSSGRAASARQNARAVAPSTIPATPAASTTGSAATAPTQGVTPVAAQAKTARVTAPESQIAAPAPATASPTPNAIYAQEYGIPVGASPVNVRATHPIDLYSPSVEPVYNIVDHQQDPPLTSEQAYVDWMVAHTNQSATYLRERWQRASLALERHLMVHQRVLMAFLLTPREWFVRSYNLPRTYENTALPIGYGQTISGPDLVMHMTDALDPQPGQRVLEIGTGSGYQSALLSHLSNYVYTIEIVQPLAEQTNQIYLDHTKAMPQFANIHRRLADGYYGWPRYAPFDRIIVTTGIDHIPPVLLQELKPGGIMVIPIGPPTGQTILKITKTVDQEGNVHLTRTDIYPGVTQIFVPFTASGGGTHNGASSGK